MENMKFAHRQFRLRNLGRAAACQALPDWHAVGESSRLALALSKAAFEEGSLRL